MIRFACRCKHIFEVADDQAGLSVQCPRCGLLADVPGAGDAGSILADGTYRLDERPAIDPEENLDILKLVYYPARQLPDGSEIDLRGPVEPPPTPLPPPDPPPPERPKYDPETGELVRVVDLDRPHPAAASHQAIPEAARLIDYNVSRESIEGSPHGLSVYASLFLPVNLMVMLITLGVHLIFTLFLLLASLFLLLTPFALAFAFLVAGIFTTSVEEIGPAEKDELPRPLRNVQLYDDYIVPGVRAFLAILLCYWPGMLVIYLNLRAAVQGSALPFPAAGPWILASLVLGAILMPAMLLTICTSGTLLNLRPDRILKLIGRSGWRYALLSLEWLIGSSIYLAGAAALFITWRSGSIFVAPFITYPLLMVGIYLCFSFCWHLGLHYRQHWSSYPWVAQQYEHRTVTIRRPTLHPKIAAADESAAKRARTRSQIR